MSKQDTIIVQKQMTEVYIVNSIAFILYSPQSKDLPQRALQSVHIEHPLSFDGLPC